MTRSPVFEAISGPFALSRWSIIVLFPLGVLAYFATNVQDSLQGNMTHAMAIFGAQFAALFVGLAARATVLRPQRNERRIVRVLIVFAIIGLVRALGIDLILISFGDPSPYSSLGRAALGAILSIVGLALVSAATNLNRASRRSQQSLTSAIELINQRNEIREAAFAELNERTVAHAENLLQAAIGKLLTEPRLSAFEVASQLEDLSEQVIRPMSHSMVKELSQPSALTVSQSQSELSTLSAQSASSQSSLLDSVEMPPKGVVVFLVAPIAAAFLLGGIGVQKGWLVTLVALTALGISIMASNAWVRRFRNAKRCSWQRVFATYLVVGIVTVGAATAAFWFQEGTWLPAWFGAVVIPLVALGVALAKAHFTHQERIEDELSNALRASSEIVLETHRTLDLRKQEFSHLLHAEIQGELVATAWALKRTLPLNEGIKQQLSELRSRLEHHFTAPHLKTFADAETEFTRLINLWQAAIRIECNVEPEVWNVCSSQPETVSVLLDVISEGFTNIVRHGSGGLAKVTITLTSDGYVSVTMMNRGYLKPQDERDEASSGLDRLRVRVRQIELLQVQANVVLRAVL